MEGHGGIILKNGTYSISKFVHNSDPVYTSIPITWISKPQNDNPNDDEVGLIQINDISWDGSVPIMNATRSNVKFYGCCLEPDDNDYDLPQLTCKDGGIFDFNYTNYYDSWTKERNGQRGTGGCRLERHNFAHIETPLDREGKSGLFILGKLIQNDSVLLLTAYIITKGQTLYVPPNTIHTNDYQRGLWRTYLEIGDIDICDLVKENVTDNKIERMSLNFYCAVTKQRMRQYDIESVSILNNGSNEQYSDQDHFRTRRQHTLLAHLNSNEIGDILDEKENEDEHLYCYCIKCDSIMEQIAIGNMEIEEHDERVIIDGDKECCFPILSHSKLKQSMSISCSECKKELMNGLMYSCTNTKSPSTHSYNLCMQCGTNKMLKFTDKGFSYQSLSRQILE